MTRGPAARAVAQIPDLSDSGSSSPATRTVGNRHTAAADTATTAAIDANTAHVPTTVMSTAAAAGPRRLATATSRPESTLAAVSSAGPSTIAGIITDWAG